MHQPDIDTVITYLPTEEGGKSLPVRSGYHPQFYYDGQDWDAVHEYPDVEIVYPGQTVRALLSFLSPDAHIGKLYPGKSFQIREGRRVVAYGTIIRILRLERSTPMQNSRHVSLLTSGHDQVLTIPHEFALSGTEVLLRKEGHRLIIEPIPPNSLLSLLTTLQEITDSFPDPDEGLLPPDDIML